MGSPVEDDDRLSLRRGTIREFDPTTYQATVQIGGSLSLYLAGVPVATSIEPAQAMVGVRCLVLFFDAANPRDALVVATYGLVGTSGPTGRYGQTLYNASSYG